MPVVTRTKFDTYEKVSLISDEISTTIWKALHDSTGDKVVLKIPKPGCLQIVQELQILSRLSHNCIIELKDSISTDNGAGIVLPLAKSGDLFGALSSAAMSEDDTKRIMYRILSALQYLHGQQIWHRDIKPENILLLGENCDPDSAVLADFGFARYCETTLSEDFVGSPHYCAPELYLRLPYDEKIDIWALGLTLFACLTRSLPYNTASQTMMMTEIVSGLPRLRQIAEQKSMPEVAFDLCVQMLTRDSKDRLSAEEALQHRWFDSVRLERLERQTDIEGTKSIVQDRFTESLSRTTCETTICVAECSQIIPPAEQSRLGTSP
jgi:serine/threonine-protein kinase Chk2